MSLSALFEFNGSDGSTTLTDDSGIPKTVTVAGACAIRVAESIVGGASLRCPGASGDYVRIQASGSELTMTGDFALDFWVKRDGSGTTVIPLSPLNTVMSSLFVTLSSAGNIQVSPTGGSMSASTSGYAKEGDFVNVGISRKGSVLTQFINGGRVGSTTSTGTMDLSDIVLGRYNPNGTFLFAGYIDRLRIYKDEYRWQYRFDPFTGAAQDSLIYEVAAQQISIYEHDPSPANWLLVEQGVNKIRDYWFGGNGKIEGTTKIDGSPDYAVSREVRLIVEKTGACIRSVWSNPIDGTYSFENINENERYTVISYDFEHSFRAIVADNITPEPM